MWPIEISQFLAQNLKHHPGSELGALEVEFGPLPVGKPGSGLVSEARVHARWLAKANRLMWWIGLLFGKVESVSGTNKARSKILKLRTRI
jgi:hypothetical protein